MRNLNDNLVSQIIIVNDLSISDNRYLSEAVSQYIKSTGITYSDFVEEFYEDYTILVQVLSSFSHDDIDSFKVDKHRNYIVCSLFKNNTDEGVN